MQILKDDIGKYKYCFEYNFNLDTLTFCRAIKTKLGYKAFGFYQGRWRFNDINIVYIIKNKYESVFINDNILEDIELYEIEKKKQILKEKKLTKLKEATDTNFVVNNVKGELYGYQKLGVEFFITNGGKAILADTMGLGKTAQSLAYIAHEKLDKTLVICPASVKYAWESEVKKWTKLKSVIIDSKTKFTPELIAGHNIFIINYDILKRFVNELTITRFDCLVCDEFHYIKNPTAQRTKHVKTIAKNIESILLLSGTPLLSRPVELFNGLQLMDPNEFNDYYFYTRRYCAARAGRFGWDVSGSSRIKELQQRINKYFLRRTKENVLTELPPKRFIDYPVELDAFQQKNYKMAEESFVEYLKEIKNKKKDEIDKAMHASRLVKLNELRQITSSGKVYAAKHIINNIIDAGEKVVVFSVYNKPLEYLKEEFGNKAVVLIGKTENKERANIIKSFQDDDSKKIFLGGMKSAGIGITLTAASNVLFLDYSWVPSDHEQSMDRIHRIGQTASSVNIYQLFSKNTIDEYMNEILTEKKKLFSRIIDNKNVSGQVSLNLVDEILKVYDREKLSTD